ncbi:MAG: 4-(cytidine 5'-diphospho)-2-C-methyl-D-erythritol kinase [Bacteroidales bacterium]|nr:4-(cytidine 5'-diphospho)-2-C-methyl-D-erythritol kinase [Bacteroidales bacterium]
MISFPNSKINLGLRVLDERSDGYHNIETIFYPIPLCDALEFVEADKYAKEDTLTTSGLPIETIGDNLVIMAIRKFREVTNIPFLKVHLHKVIPMGAGLGGGSSDASYIIKSLNHYYDNTLSEDQLEKISLEIGSDCPFFIKNAPALAQGRGEILKPIPQILKDKYIVLVNPDIHVSTKEAYQNCVSHSNTSSLENLVNEPISEWKHLIYNDFEEYVFKKHSQIGKLKRLFYEEKATYSSMTGSGSAIYGIFEEKPSLPPELTKRVIFEGFL